jgi:hypothetical protein
LEGTGVVKAKVIEGRLPVEDSTAPLVAVDVALVITSFVVCPKAYFVHISPKTSLQSDGYAVPPQAENRSSLVRVAMLCHVLITSLDSIVPHV